MKIEKVDAWRASNGILYLSRNEALKAELCTKFSEWYANSPKNRLHVNEERIRSEVLFDWLYCHQDEIVKLFMIDKIECVEADVPIASVDIW